MFKQVKRGIALALAAALAFGIAPVAGIGSPTVALAAAGNLSTTESVTFTLGTPDTTYQTITADKLSALVGASATATVDDKTVIGLALDADLRDDGSIPVSIEDLKKGIKKDGTAWTDKVTIADATTKVNIKALKAGTATIRLEATDGAKTTQLINVTVFAQTTGVKLTDKDGAAIPENGMVSVVEGGTVDVKVALENMKTDISALGHKSDGKTSGYSISDEKITTATFVGGTFSFFGMDEGTADVTLYLAEDSKTVSFHVSVIPQTRLTTTIDDVQYVYDGAWKVKDVAKNPVIYLNPTDRAKSISVASNNGNLVSYSTSDTAIVVGKTGLIEAKLEADGKVTAGVYTVNVDVAENTKTGQVARSATIDVIVSSKKAKLVSLEVKDSTGASIGKTSASVIGPDTYAKGEVAGEPIKLSVMDKNSETLLINANVDMVNFVDVVSSDEKVVTCNNGLLTAVGAGNATITITAKPDSTAEPYEAVVKVPVTVSAKRINNAITVTPITLTADKPEAMIDARAAYGNKLTYPTLAREANNTDSAADQKAGFHDYNDLGTGELYDVIVDKNTGKVTYKKNGRSGYVFVKIVGEANADSEAPQTTYVKVTYGTVEKKDSDLTIAKERMEMTVGDTASGVAVSTQTLSYTSDSPEIASVDAKGVITAVAAGTAVITVTAAENDKFRKGVGKIFVTVKAKSVDPTPTPTPTEKLDNPMTAKGKVLNLKAKTLQKKDINRKRAKAFKIQNAKGTLTFVKSSGKAKITVTMGGGVKIKKGLKKGAYKVKVKVTAAGDATYKAVTKTVTVTVKVR